MTVEDMKTGFVERIGGTIFVVNAMPAENAKHTQEELVKALIAKEAMALQEADVAWLTLLATMCFGDFSKNISKPLDKRVRSSLRSSRVSRLEAAATVLPSAAASSENPRSLSVQGK